MAAHGSTTVGLIVLAGLAVGGEWTEAGPPPRPAPERALVTPAVRPNALAVRFQPQDASLRRWLTSHRARYTPLSAPERLRSQRILNRAAAKYPPALLTSLMDRVLVVQSLSFDRVEVGGTYHGRTVIIANYGVARGSTDRWIEECFHHEVSSLMLHAHRSVFPQTRWDRALPVGFSYGTGGFSAVREGRARETPETRHLTKGFVCEYSRAALEEDFNTLAERLWSGDPRIWQWKGQHPRFEKKLNTMLLFLSRVDARLNEAWFRSLARGTKRSPPKPATLASPTTPPPAASRRSPAREGRLPTPATTIPAAKHPLPWLVQRPTSQR